MTRKELEKLFNAKKQRKNKQTDKISHGFVNTTVSEFLEWYDEARFNKDCEYCGTTNEQSRQLFDMRAGSTRGGRRGKRLELDRKDPFAPYDDLSNVIWCCY